MPSGRIRSFAGEVTNLIAPGQGSGKKRLWEELGVKVDVSDPGEPGVEGVTLAPPHCERRIPALATQRLHPADPCIGSAPLYVHPTTNHESDAARSRRR